MDCLRFLLISWISLFFTFPSTHTVLADENSNNNNRNGYDQNRNENIIFPIINKILQQRHEKHALTAEQTQLLQQCATKSDNNGNAMYQLASQLTPSSNQLGEVMFPDAPDKKVTKIEFAMELYKYAAEVKDHTLSQAKLGRFYADGIDGILPSDPNQAVHYYRKAGENGHHPSLYNCGKLLFEGIATPDVVGSLGFLQTAALFSKDHPELRASPETTQAAIQAHAHVAQVVVQRMGEWNGRQLADMFVFGSTQQRLHKNIERLWIDAMLRLDALPMGATNTEAKPELVQVHGLLQSIIREHSSAKKQLLSPLQWYLVLDMMNDVLKMLAATDVEYREEAMQMAASMEEAQKEMELIAKQNGDHGGRREEL